MQYIIERKTDTGKTEYLHDFLYTDHTFMDWKYKFCENKEDAKICNELEANDYVSKLFNVTKVEVK